MYHSVFIVMFLIHGNGCFRILQCKYNDLFSKTVTTQSVCLPLLHYLTKGIFHAIFAFFLKIYCFSINFYSFFLQDKK